MELISVPPRLHIRFRRSLVHDLLVIISLVQHADWVEGLSDWIQNTAGRLQTQNTTTLDGVTTVLVFATGVQGYLVDALSEDEAAYRFEAMMDKLEALDSLALQQVALRNILARAKRLEIVNQSAELPAGPDALLVLLEHFQAYRVENWQSGPPPMPLEAFAALLFDPDALHDQFLMAFDYLWHQFYATRAADDLRQEQEAVQYHESQAYLADLPTVFQAVTGRTLPEPLHQYLPSVQEVDMIPSCHIGAYVVVSMLDHKLWIGFNANYVPPDKELVNTAVNIATLYPVLRALADETRLKIVSHLRRYGEQNVGDIADALHLSVSTTSRHLKLLHRTGILDLRRDGAMRYYSLKPQTLLDVGESLSHLAETVPVAEDQVAQH